MSERPTQPSPYKARVRPDYVGLILGGASAVVILWFLYKVMTAILLVFLAFVVAIALSAGVNWFVRHGIKRKPAAALTLLIFFATVGVVGWLVIPKLAAQIVVLVNSLPDLIVQIDQQMMQLLARYPDLQKFAGSGGGGQQDIYPAALNIFRGVGGVSLTVLGGLTLTIIFLSTVMYVVLDPKPILRAYIGSLPRQHRAAGMRAYRRASRSVIGWTEASLIVGLIQAIASFIFLTLMGVPAALVWAVLAFFAEFIPRIGGYIMAIPPVIVAVTLGPMTAVWVGLFYLVSNELLGNFVAPRIRGQTMSLHPVMLLFFTLAFALALGLLGAIVATPAAAFVAAFYSEFYIKRPLRRPDPGI